MSDPLALVSVLAGVISLSGTVISSSLTLRDTVDLLRARWVAKIKRLEPYALPTVLYPLLSPLTDTLGIMTHNVLLASDTTTLDYRARRMASCSMTGVAAALVAQVTNTSMQQEFTPALHWSVSALWTCGLVLSLLSVYYSFLLHHWLAGFASADEVRRAFTHRGLVTSSRRVEGVPSLTVAARLWVPAWLLSASIGCYVLTLGLYWALAWKGWWGVGAEAGRGIGNRNVFICYILTVLGAVAVFTVPSAVGKILEDVDNLHLYREELKHVCRSGPDVPDPGVSAAKSVVGRNEQIGAAAVALLTAAEAHRSAGTASKGLADELDRLVDELARGKKKDVSKVRTDV
ncbi:uncharacterized protein LAJ45_03940 [Morchella importuna]|uniref:uncharacterized protein n=1 Tax=Morchella importuna TaxID=1174673 RepID=UPI001E8D266E|nr:uncharacterized protein LAJ45_03940 [Morchella importuna]KAH8151947.1 hypothetical protein LAJ45_03940 [Morchella importuna]